MKGTSRYFLSILISISFVTSAGASVQHQTSDAPAPKRRVTRPATRTTTPPKTSRTAPPRGGGKTQPPRTSDDGGQHPPRDEGHHGDGRTPPRTHPPRRPRWVPGISITIGGGNKRDDDKKKDEKDEKKKDEEKADKKKDEKDPKEPEPADPMPVDTVARPLKYDTGAYRRLADSMLRQERIDAALRMIELLKEQEYFEYTGTFDDDVIAEAAADEPSGDLAAARDLALDLADDVVTVGKKDKKAKKSKKAKKRSAKAQK